MFNKWPKNLTGLRQHAARSFEFRDVINHNWPEKKKLPEKDLSSCPSQFSAGERPVFVASRIGKKSSDRAWAVKVTVTGNGSVHQILVSCQGKTAENSWGTLVCVHVTRQVAWWVNPAQAVNSRMKTESTPTVKDLTATLLCRKLRATLWRTDASTM